jgi:hypothetical protein
MKKGMTIVVLTIALLGIFTGNLWAVTKSEIRQAVSVWSGVPLSQITSETHLNGLGGKVWPPDSPALVATLQQLSGKTITPIMSNPWVDVWDIDETLDADDDEE